MSCWQREPGVGRLPRTLQAHPARLLWLCLLQAPRKEERALTWSQEPSLPVLGLSIASSLRGSGLPRARRKQSLKALDSCQISFPAPPPPALAAPLPESCLPPGMLGFHTFPQSSKSGSQLGILRAKLTALGRALGRSQSKRWVLCSVTPTQEDRIPQQTQELGVVTHTRNSRCSAAGFPARPWLPSELEASLSYVKPCPSQTKSKCWADGSVGRIPRTHF